MPPAKIRGPVGNLWRDILVLFLAIPDRRVPLYVKGGVLLGIGYLLNPVDLLPEFIPFAGFVDDLLIVPLVMRYSFRLIPPHIVEELRKEADSAYGLGLKIVIGTALVLLVWVALIIGLGAYLISLLF